MIMKLGRICCRFSYVFLNFLELLIFKTLIFQTFTYCVEKEINIVDSLFHDFLN